MKRNGGNDPVGLIYPISKRVCEIRELMGRELFHDRDEAKRRVDAFRRGDFLFYGKQPVHVGFRNIDWTGSLVAHQEWPSELNRFSVLASLALIYLETGEGDLAELARGVVEDWLEQHSYSAESPPGEGDSSLSLSIRIPLWWMSVVEMASSGVFDDAFIDRMLESSRGQLDCLVENMSPRGNQRVSQLDCLLFCGLCVPGLDRHLAFAVRNFNDIFARQVHGDGSFAGHTPSYHGWMRDIFTRYWRVSRSMPELGLRIDAGKILRMWDYSLCSAAPDGGSIGLHDSRAWCPSSSGRELMHTRNELVKDMAASAESWNPESERSRCFPDAGQVFIRTGWDRDDSMLCFDATRYGGSHCHLCRNSMIFYSGTRMLLCDTGIFSYEMSDPFALYGKSTPAHNTVNVGGMSQSEADPRFLRTHVFDDIAVVCSCYQGGYWPGEYTWGWREGQGRGTFGMHTRAVLWLFGRGIVVWDTVTFDRTGREYAAHWQFPAGGCELDPDNNMAWTAGGEDNILIRVLASSDRKRMTVYEGMKDPIRGWLASGIPGEYVPAPQVAVECVSGARRSTLVTLITPFRNDILPEMSVKPVTEHHQHVDGFEIIWPDGERDLVAASSNLEFPIGTAGQVDTNASLTAVSLCRDGSRRALLFDGSFLCVEGRTLVDRPETGTYSVGFEEHDGSDS